MDFDVDRFREQVARVDEEHHDGMRTMVSDIKELHSETRIFRGGASRRDFLVKGAFATAAVTIGSQMIPLSSLWSPAFGQTLDDPTIATYAASVENAAVAAYGIGAAKLTGPALQAAMLFQSHHKAHAAAFVAASGKADPGPNKHLVAALGPQFTGAKDAAAVLTLAYGLENAAASTYYFALGALTTMPARKLTASIMPIEAGHAVAIQLALGNNDPAAFVAQVGKDASLLPVSETDSLALPPASNPIAGP